VPNWHRTIWTNSISTARPCSRRPLTPEEEAIDDFDGEEDEIDDLLPADLWFRSADRGHPASYTPGW
jgi:hypothetical protein